MALEFRCTDAGAACGAQFKSASEQDLLGKVSDHLRSKHKVQHVSKTLQKYAVRVAREG